MNRYFLIVYSVRTQSAYGNGNMAVKSDNFPSRKWIVEEACRIGGVEESAIVIINIFEFKSEEDFDSFNS